MISPTLNRFTIARESVWDAIDNYPPLHGVFKSKFRYESGARARSVQNPSDEREPTATTECPAILILPQRLPSAWQFNNQQKLDYTLSVSIWGDTLYVDELERIMGLVIDAVYTSKAPEAKNSYIRAAINGQMPVIEPWSIQAVQLNSEADSDNRQSVLMLTGAITLPLTYQPTNYANGQ